MRARIAANSMFAMALVACVIGSIPYSVFGQDQAQTRSSNAAGDSVPPTVAEAIRALEAQIQRLNSEVGKLRSNQQRQSVETAQLRDDLSAARAELAAVTHAPKSQIYAVSNSPSGQSSSGQTVQGPTLDQRIAKLEDNQQLTDARIAEQNQTKVESGSKYRLRLSGIALVNVFGTQGTVDNLDYPQLAVHRDPLQSSRAFGASLRQSQIELSVFGPDVAGARTSANLKFDFAGGFTGVPNGVTMGIARLRTGTLRLDWTRTSIVAGQDNLFFAPLTPTSLASLAIPPLSYSGRLWSWAPQVRIEHQIALTESNTLLVQGGFLDSLTGDIPQPGYRYPTAGEQSGQPGFAARVALRHRALGRDFTLGAGGYYARQSWGLGRHVNSWAGTADLNLPIASWMVLSGEFYRGRAVGGLGGGIGQSILLSDSLLYSATQVRGLDSMGGWLQMKIKPKPNFELNAAFGQDNPYSAELRRFPATAQYYGLLQSRNLSYFVNFVYQVRSDVLFSLEYRRLQSYPLDTKPEKANQISLSMGYLF